MNRKYNRQTLLIPFMVMSLVSFILIGLLFTVHHLMALSALCIVMVIVIICIFTLHRGLLRSEHYIQNLSTTIDKGKSYAVNELPIGVVLLDEHGYVEWHNQFMNERIDRPLLADPINEVFPNLLNQLKVTGVDDVQTQYKDYKFSVKYVPDSQILYFFDITDKVETYELYQESKPVIGTIFLDNYDEITQNMSDANRTEMSSMMTTEINRWAEDNDVYVKRYSSDQFIIVLNNRILQQIEKTKFNLLDTIREKSREKKTHITLSIGIGEGADNLIILGELA